MKKLVTLAGCAALCMAFALPSMAAEGLVNVGGHMKGPTLSDNVWGNATVNGVKRNGSYSAGTYFTTHAFIMYVSKDITDNVSVHAVPDFGNSGAGATPSLGKYLGVDTLKTTSSSISLKFNELIVKYNLPDYGLQLKAGYFTLPFTQDYGKELFWGEQWTGGKSTLGYAWHDSGLEIYKPFEFGGISLPTSLYLVNGNSSSARDNNNSKAVMLHVEPQFAGVKTFASYGAGKWGDAVVLSSGTAITDDQAGLKNKTFYRWSTGAEYAFGKLKFRGELAGSRHNDYLKLTNGTRKNYDTFGYYGKVFYTIVPEKLTAMYHYDNYVKDVASSNLIIQEKYDTNEFVLSYEMAPAATLFLGYTRGNWRNNDIPTKKDAVEFNRLQTYVRVTF